MKMKKSSKTTHPIQKASFALLAACTLFSACGKHPASPDLKNPTSVPAAPTATHLLPNTFPSPTEIPKLTLVPEQASIFTFLPVPDETDKTSLSDYIPQEKLDAIFSLSYYPDAVTPQLYARYQGTLRSPIISYCIDLIQINESTDNLLLNIKILDGRYRFLKYGDSSITQNLFYYIDQPIEPDTSKEILKITDLNEDGYDDFLFDLGLTGKNNLYSIAFLYDTENEAYTLLGHFTNPTYIPDKKLILEDSWNHGALPDAQKKYIISGSKAILSEVLYDLDGIFTYQKLVGNELVTVLENVTHEKICEVIDFDTWRNTPISIE